MEMIYYMVLSLSVTMEDTECYQPIWFKEDNALYAIYEVCMENMNYNWYYMKATLTDINKVNINIYIYIWIVIEGRKYKR